MTWKIAGAIQAGYKVLIDGRLCCVEAACEWPDGHIDLLLCRNAPRPVLTFHRHDLLKVEVTA